MSIGKAILARTEDEREMWTDIEALKYATGRVMFCQISGVVLDYRTAVYVTVTTTDGKSSAMVINGPVWDNGKANLIAELERVAPGSTVEVIDGRELETKRKAYARAERAERAARKATQATPQD